MSIVTDKLVDELADLSRLQFEGIEKETIKSELEKMISFVNQLHEVNTEGIEPLRHLNFEINKMREDQALKTIDKDEALSNASLFNQDFFIAPKSIKK